MKHTPFWIYVFVPAVFICLMSVVILVAPFFLGKIFDVLTSSGWVIPKELISLNNTNSIFFWASIINLMGYFFIAVITWWNRRELTQISDIPWVISRSVRLFLPGRIPVKQKKSLPSNGSDPIHIESIELDNIRCFAKLKLQFSDRSKIFESSLFVGDNATGKSTLLRCIALGLCPESEATFLIKRLNGDLVRKGFTEGKITLRLRASDFEGSITTTLFRDSGGREVVRQNTYPHSFPWDRLFVCGYGTQRTNSRPTSPKRYVAMEAVSSLFSGDAELLNPEYVFSRRSDSEREQVQQVLMNLLMLDNDVYDIRQSEQGLQLRGPWGEQLLESISDGYRSTTQWVLDVMGRTLLAQRALDAGGILLIDEIEQHLHPRWQRHVIQRIRTHFPNFQLISTTHTPLTVSGLTDIESSQLVLLDLNEEGVAQKQQVHASAFRGMRADQLLTATFGLFTTQSPKVARDLERYSWLLSVKRTEIENAELIELKKNLEQAWSLAENEIAAEVADAVTAEVKKRFEAARKEVDPSLIRLEVQRQVHDIFIDE